MNAPVAQEQQASNRDAVTEEVPKAKPQPTTVTLEERHRRTRGRAIGERCKLLGLDAAVLRDVVLRLAGCRASELCSSRHEGLFRWLATPEGSAAYALASHQRSLLLETAASYTPAERAQAAAVAGVGTEPSQLTCVELWGLLEAWMQLNPLPPENKP